MPTNADLSWPELVHDLREGDSRAWDRFFNHYAHRLTVVVHWRLPRQMRCRWPVEDVVQEIFGKAVERRSMLTDPADGGAWRWLLAIAFRVLAGIMRREMVRMIERRSCDFSNAGPGTTRRVGMSGFAGSIARASVKAMHSEDVRQLLRLLDRLREDDRDALLMRFYEELSYDEIASRLGITAETARQRVSRLLARLRGKWPSPEGSAA